jgi:hypothetical protein
VTVFSVKHKFIFMHIPKNGGTAIRQALGKVCPDLVSVDSVDAKYREYRGGHSNHFPFWKVQELLADHPEDFPKGLADFTQVMVIRNPWARMVSLYQHRLKKLDSLTGGKARHTDAEKAVVLAGFKPWLLTTESEADAMLTRTPQFNWISGEARVIQFEDLDKTAKSVFRHIGVNLEKIPRSNVGKAFDYHDWYDHETRDHVKKYFGLDLKATSYGF